MTVKRALDILTLDGLIIREEKKNQILYRANMENFSFRFAKISYNLSFLDRNNVVEYLLNQNPGISSIVLYGSFAKGENDKNSDLDILVISTPKGIESKKLSKRLKTEVNIMTFTSSQWTKQAKTNRAFYLDVITEGVVLYGIRPVIG
jgi:predicted nucleotidyltransferase